MMKEAKDAVVATAAAVDVVAAANTPEANMSAEAVVVLKARLAGETNSEAEK